MGFERTYIVNYDIRAKSAGAEKALQSFKTYAEGLQTTFTQIENGVNNVVSQLNRIQSQPIKLNLADFQKQLKLMEQAVKISANRMRNAINQALQGKKIGAKNANFMKTDSFLKAQMGLSQKDLSDLKKQYSRARAAFEKNALSTVKTGNETALKENMERAKKLLDEEQKRYNALARQYNKNSGATIQKAKDITKAVNVLADSNLGQAAMAVDNMAKALSRISQFRGKNITINAKVVGLNDMERLATAMSTIGGRQVSGSKQQKSGRGKGTAKQVTATGIPSKSPYVSPTTSQLRIDRNIPIKVTVDRSSVGADIRSSLINAQNLLNARPLKVKAVLGKDGVTVPKNLKSVNIPVKAKLFKKDIDLSALKKSAPTITLRAKFGISQVNKALSEAQNSAKKPASIKVKLDISGAQAQLKALLSQIKSASPQTIKVGFSGNTGGKNASRGGGGAAIITGGGGKGTVIIPPSGGSGSGGGAIVSSGRQLTPVQEAIRQNSLQKARWYPLTGNTSLGANTPMIVDMAKGMGVMMAVGGAMSAVSNSISQSFEYENLMETAKAILQNNSAGPTFEDDFQNMAKTVRNVGIKTKFTAPEVAGAAKFLAMAGLDVNTINKAIRPVSNVALAGDLDLATTADKLTNIMTAFNMSGNQIESLSDMLVNTFTRSNTSMMQLAEASQYAAPLANTYGMSVNEMLALMGVMGNAGIQGSMAGTSLRMIMQNIVKPSKNQKVWWDTLGVSRTNADGTPRSVTAIMQDIAKSVPKEKLIEPIMNTFRVTSAAAAAQIIKNLQTVDDIAQSNLESAGLAQRVGEKKQGTVQGLLAQVKSTFTEGILQGVEGNQDKIKDALVEFRNFFANPNTVKQLGDLVTLFLDLAKMMAEVAKMAMKVYSAFGPVLMMLWKFQFYMKIFGGVMKSIIGIFAGFRSVFAPLMGTFGMAGAGTATGTAAVASTAALTSPAAVSRAAANARIAQTTGALASSRLAAASLESSIARKQMQWYALGAMAPGLTNRHVLPAGVGIYNGSVTNPAAIPSRIRNLQMTRAAEVALMQGQLAQMNSKIARQQAARQALIQARAAERIAGRRVSSDVLNRAVRMGRISRGAAMGMSISSGFRSAATWGIAGLGSSMNLMGGFTSIVGVVGKALGALVNPITLTIGAIGGLAYGIIKHNEAIAEARNRFREMEARSFEAARATRASGELYLDTGSKIEAVQLQDRGFGPAPVSRIPQFSKDIRYAQYYDNKALATTGEAKRAYDVFYKPYYRLMYGKEAPEYNSAENKLRGIGLWGYGTTTKTSRGSGVNWAKKSTSTTTTVNDKTLADIYQRNFGTMGIADDNIAEARYYQAIARPLYAALDSDTYKEATRKIRDIAAEMKARQENGQAINAVEYRNRMLAVANQYGGNYQTFRHASLNELTNGSGDYTDIFYTYETQKILHEKINEIVSRFQNTYGKSEDAIDAFNKLDFVNIGIQEQLEAIGRLVGVVPIMVKDANGTIQRLYIGLNENGQFDMAQFHETLARMGIAFTNSAYNNAMLLIEMIEKIKSLPGMAQKVTDGMYMQILSHTQNSGFANMDKTIAQNFASYGGFSDTNVNYAKQYIYEGLKKRGITNTEKQRALVDQLRFGTGIAAGWSQKKRESALMTFYNEGRLSSLGGDYTMKSGNAITYGQAIESESNNANPFGGGGGYTPPKATGSGKNGQKDYQSHYSRNAARPTQINISIDSLARFDKTFIAKNAEEREMVEAMEDRMAQAISMLTSQLSSQLSVVAENAASA